MKYFFDTEFNEDMVKPLFGRSRHQIELISIAIVAEDGREYYAVSKDFDLKKAWFKKSPGKEQDTEFWLRENVLKPIWKEYYDKQSEYAKEHFNSVVSFTLPNVKRMIREIGKTRQQMASEIFNFVNPDVCFPSSAYLNSPFRTDNSYISKYFVEHDVCIQHNCCVAQPIFYGYYADYDWVVFCSLFGNMLALPAGFPKYCRDLKQCMDEMAERRCIRHPGHKFNQTLLEHHTYEIKKTAGYPSNQNEHNALSDARWNRELYAFIKKTDLILAKP